MEKSGRLHSDGEAAADLCGVILRFYSKVFQTAHQLGTLVTPVNSCSASFVIQVEVGTKPLHSDWRKLKQFKVINALQALPLRAGRGMINLGGDFTKNP